jgi:hypothetical protein
MEVSATQLKEMIVSSGGLARSVDSVLGIYRCVWNLVMDSKDPSYEWQLDGPNYRKFNWNILLARLPPESIRNVED